MTGRSSRTATCTPVVFLGDQCAVPRQQGVRRHDRGDVPQDAASECLGFRRQSTALSVGEPQPSGPELFPQHAVLLLEIVDDIALLLVHPTGERDENEPQREAWCQGYQRPDSSAAWALPDLKATLSIKTAARLWRRSGFWTIRPGQSIRLKSRCHRGLRIGEATGPDGLVVC